MKKLPIFVGLPPITEEAAIELALYWRVTGDAEGIIDEKGHLRHGKEYWGRPMADKAFNALKDAFQGSDASCGVTVEDSQVKIDFSKLQYNLEFVKEIVAKYHLGVCDSMRGLMFYEPKSANGTEWYLESEWRFRRVSVDELGLSENRISAISPNQVNPRTAEWKTLYFAN